MEKKLIELFKSHFKEDVHVFTPLKAHGSYRKIYRLANTNRSVIGIANLDRAENIAFLTFSRHFRKVGLPVPEIYVEDLDKGLYLEEDLGDLTLSDILAKARVGVDGSQKTFWFPLEIETIYKKVIHILPKFQIEGGKNLDYTLCYPRAAYDRQSMVWDLNYYKYNFLKLARIPFDEQKLEEDFQELVDFLTEADSSHFLYRDFQSRNIMLKGNRRNNPNGQDSPFEPFFIDYQGGRRGALQYDIASLLNQSTANIPFDARNRLLEEYLKALEAYIPVDRSTFLPHYYGFVFIRLMQNLGAYGLRGIHERKIYFLQSIPYAVRNLEYFLNTVQLPIELPELMSVFQAIVSSFDRREKSQPLHKLTVRIVSFSYKLGIPLDDTEHGGGFVFDCRSLPNPGRIEAFKQKTGLDNDVREYLEKMPEVTEFLKNCFALVERAVEVYLSRNFTNLMISFGCTGGQHRSVYVAERLTGHLKEKYPIAIDLQHRELVDFQ
jgi:aminoglycoside/choline kinase family phosphotransferase